MNTSELTKLLRAKYSPPEYATFTNVANGTGSNASRWADAVSMGIWPSRGLTLHGFELKTSRSDWLREKNNPAKAESVYKFCDHWWLIAVDGIVKEDELPETWGLQVANGRGLKIVKAAPKLEPISWSRGFLAALLRRSTEQTVDDAMLKAQYQLGRDDEKKHQESMKAYALKDADELREKLKEFEDASGIHIDRYTWNCGRIGEVVKMLLQRGALDQMRELAKSARRIADIADESVVAMGGTDAR